MVEIRMLGQLTVRRDGVILALPASRKVRALFAYLALAPQAVPRTRLCELLWDVPSDPRGELRWCLSKMRAFIDEPGHLRVDSQADTVGLKLSDSFLDAIEVEQAAAKVDTIASEQLQSLEKLSVQDFLEGLEIDGSPLFNAWLTAQRRRFRSCRAAILEQLVKTSSDREALHYLEKWLELAPFDWRVHHLMLDSLARCGKIREGDEHVAATSRTFAAEDLDCTPMHDAWRSARARYQAVSPVRVVDDPVKGSPVRRASVAVMPFVDRSTVSASRGGIGDALAHDVITRLAKMHSLFVIAQGTMFALHDRSMSSDEAAKILEVDYIVSGFVLRRGTCLMVAVEVAATKTGSIVWAETFNHNLDDAFVVLDEIGNQIVASIASEIETIERNLAVLTPPSSLDAWGAHHRGLWHMYRFNKTDNDRAQQFFELAVRLDPTFSRAYAGLSFTHFQNAFQGWAERGPHVERAYEAAGKSVMADDRDPAAHLSIGRALWLRGRHDQSILELEQAVELSPNFALAHYTLSFVHSQTGDPRAAIVYSDHSRQLSPFDPLLFGMLGARAMALVRSGHFKEAAEWGVKAATRPNAHAHILAIAAFSLALAGRLDEAAAHLAAIHATIPNYGVDDFLAAMQFDADGERAFRTGAKRLGMPEMSRH